LSFALRYPLASFPFAATLRADCSAIYARCVFFFMLNLPFALFPSPLGFVFFVLFYAFFLLRAATATYAIVIDINPMLLALS